MQKYALLQLDEETINALVTLEEQAEVSNKWRDMQIPLTSEECTSLERIKATLRERQLVHMNEATLWARAIYPLLLLAEQRHIQAWSGVPLRAVYPTFELEGETDGALAPSVGGKIRPPYLIVHEAKRGVDAPDPQYQLYGEMLAAAWLNWNNKPAPEQEIFGCYTVNDTWAFVRAVVGDIESEKPTFDVEFAPVYNGISDAERIVELLKFIVAEQL